MTLKSVYEHNQERAAQRLEREQARLRTGVACPKCGQELRWREVYATTWQYHPPTTAPANCGDCGLTIELEK